MSDLKLELFDVTPDAGPGRFADKKALPILQLCLDNKLSVNDAAKKLIAMLPEPAQHQQRSAETDLFGSFLCDMAGQIPYHHSAQTRLAQLIQRLAQSTKFQGLGDEEGYQFCYTMDNFKMHLRESYSPYFVDDPDDPLSDQYIYHTNFSGFLARLTQCGFLSYSALAFWTLREALEKKYQDQDVFNCLVSSAAVWILLAGQAIYTQVVETPISKEHRSALWSLGEMYHGPETGKERWRFWKERFGDTAGKKEANEKCRELAKKAAGLMAAIEEAMKF